MCRGCPILLAIFACLCFCGSVTTSDVITPVHQDVALRCNITDALDGTAPLTWWRVTSAGHAKRIFTSMEVGRTPQDLVYTPGGKYAISGNSYDLEILNVQFADHGRYVCETSKDKFTASLTVVDALTCEASKTNDGNLFTCTLPFRGPAPELEMSWRDKNQQYSSVIADRPGHVVRLLPVRPGTSTPHTCTVTSAAAPAAPAAAAYTAVCRLKEGRAKRDTDQQIEGQSLEPDESSFDRECGSGTRVVMNGMIMFLVLVNAVEVAYLAMTYMRYKKILKGLIEHQENPATTSHEVDPDPSGKLPIVGSGAEKVEESPLPQRDDDSRSTLEFEVPDKPADESISQAESKKQDDGISQGAKSQASKGSKSKKSDKSKDKVWEELNVPEPETQGETQDLCDTSSQKLSKDDVSATQEECKDAEGETANQDESKSVTSAKSAKSTKSKGSTKTKASAKSAGSAKS